jgi:hypothetical protein
MEKDELFILIHSMDKSEKGYFKKFAGLSGQKEQSTYTRLFDCISAMPSYNVSLIKTEFKGEKILQHLSVTKHYLKNLIVRALRNYYEDQLPSVGHLLDLADACVMEHKGLSDALLHRIEKGKSLAVEEGRFANYFSWVGLYWNWLATYGERKSAQTTAQLEEEYKEEIKNHINEMDYVWMGGVVHKYYEEFGVTSAKEIVDKMKELLHHPLFSNPAAPLTVRSHYYRTMTLRHIYNFTGQNDKILPLLRESVNELDGRWASVAPPGNYVQLLIALIDKLGKEDLNEMGRLIERAKLLLRVNKKQMRAQVAMLQQCTLLGEEMRWHLFKGEPQSVFPLADLLQKNLAGAEKSFPLFELGGLMMQAYAWCELHQFAKAVTVINKIINSKYDAYREGVLEAHWISVVCHIELGNFSILKSQVTAALNYAKAFKQPFTDDKRMGGYFLELGKFLEKGDKQEGHKKMADFLAFLKTGLPHRLDFMENWLQWKLAGSPR